MVPPVGDTTLTTTSALLGSTPAPHTGQGSCHQPIDLTFSKTTSKSLFEGKSLETLSKPLFAGETLEIVSKPPLDAESHETAPSSPLDKEPSGTTSKAHPRVQIDPPAPTPNANYVDKYKEPDSPADGTPSMISTSNDEDAIVDCTSTTARRNTDVRGEHASRADGLGLEGKPMPSLVTTVPDLSSTQLWCVPGQRRH